MTTTPVRRVRMTGTQRREQLLDVGRALFAQRGYDGTSVEEVALRAGVSKPVVTRALNTLGTLGYLRRERDEADRRNIFVAQTAKGADFLEGFGSLIDSGEAERVERTPRMALG